MKTQVHVSSPDRLHRSVRSLFASCVSTALLMTACEGPIDGEFDDEQSDDVELPATAPLGPEANRASLPVYEVVDSGMNPDLAKRLGEAFALKRNDISEEGLLDEYEVVRFLDSKAFQSFPTRAVSFTPAPDEDKNQVSGQSVAPDYAALARLKPVPTKDAIEKTLSTLQEVGLDLRDIRPAADHTRFEARGRKNQVLTSAAIDTVVNLQPMAGSIPVIGTGSKAKVVFNPQGEVTQLYYAKRKLEPVDSMAVLSLKEGLSLCQESLFAEGLEGDYQPTVSYTYEVSAQAKRGDKIVPKFNCGGTVQTKEGPVDLRARLLDAAADRAHAELDVVPDGSRVYAEVEVEGGQAPYRYQWHLGNGEVIDTGDVPRLEYDVLTRDAEGSVTENLHLVITDAHGIQTRVSDVAWVDEPQRMPSQDLRVGGVRDAGLEWIGTCGGLGGSQNNAKGFRDKYAADGVTIRFDWGNNSAWERDFKDSVFSGNDDAYADNVDIVFFTGHAGGSGFNFCSSNDDTELRYTDAKWGNDIDLEWLVVAACGPLQLTSGGLSWAQRWGSAFDRLHLIMAYANVSYDNEIEGEKFGHYTLKNNPLTVRGAWVQTATDVQPSSVTYAVMGVLGQNGALANYSEYFWGHGTTGADVPASQVTGWWHLSGPS